jgi:2-polyprenyl-3-methyl-5-hydroxy-6-metoxy-1,4-benzoquinol methylase
MSEAGSERLGESRKGAGSRVSAAGIDFSRFEDITYESFRRRALDPTLTVHEKVGFPDGYREGKEGVIFDDVDAKLTRLLLREQVVVDIGAGCGELARLMMERCAENGHRLFQVDSPEMLALLPEAPHAERVAGRFPDDCDEFLDQLRGQADCVLAYGVLPCVFVESNVFEFVDRALELLAEGGQLLLADLPNLSKRKRFFASEAGVRFHQEFMETAERPDVAFNVLEPGAFDDAVVLAIVSRCRSAGFDAYVVPQRKGLPFANRREDILVNRP